MLHIQVDPHSGIPVYRQMMDQIEYYMASGNLKAGDQLPSIREMARTLRVNPTTVVKAYNELAHKDVIELRQGKGGFVKETTKQITKTAMVKILQRLARQLVVEAVQLGASVELLQEVITKEMESMKTK